MNADSLPMHKGTSAGDVLAKMGRFCDREKMFRAISLPSEFSNTSSERPGTGCALGKLISGEKTAANRKQS